MEGIAVQERQVEELVRRAQQRERAAFGELYELYGKKIYAYLSYNLGGRAQDAEDLTEEVFLKVLERNLRAHCSIHNIVCLASR